MSRTGFFNKYTNLTLVLAPLDGRGVKFTTSVPKRCNIPNLVKQSMEDDGC